MTDETTQPAPDAPAVETPFADQAALDALERQAGSAAQPQPGAATAGPQLTEADFKSEAGMLVSMLLGGISKGIEATQGVKVAFPAETVDKGAERLLPLLVKYQGQIPPWILAYKEEFLAGMWVAGVMFETYKQVQAAKAGQPAKKAGDA